LPRLLEIDTAALESAYHEFGRRIHPDRFASARPQIQDASLQATALLTRAYRTLRDPISRGRYWLELHGRKLGENNKEVPPELAELVFDVQEKLSDSRPARGENEAEFRQGLLELKSERASLQSLLDELYAELAENFAAFDGCGGPGPDHLFAELRLILSKLAYLKTLARDVDRALEDVAAD
jgi:molecular chaperone HscB